MLASDYILGLYNLLPSQEQEKCRAAIGAAPVSNLRPAKAEKLLLPEHATPFLVKMLIVKEKGIKYTGKQFNKTNLQAETVC